MDNINRLSGKNTSLRQSTLKLYQLESVKAKYDFHEENLNGKKYM